MVPTTFPDRLLAPAGALMCPPPGMAFDFTRPAGEPALVGPGSISWRIFKNPVSLFVGGVAAVILELAEPSVRSGVRDHSSFRRDAVMRLRRTGTAAMVTIYGPRSVAQSMIAGVMRAHDRVRGTTSDGTAYKANDPRLLDWVQATASFGFVEAYSRFASPLSDAERSQAFAESEPAARLYGATGAPTSLAEWERLLAETQATLEPSDTILEFLDIMRAAPILPRPLRAIQTLAVRAAVDLIPPDLRAVLQLAGSGLTPTTRATVAVAGRLADRIPLRRAPPSQSCVRMGLDPDFLYRRARQSNSMAGSTPSG